jgi:hypothetical protein
VRVVLPAALTPNTDPVVFEPVLNVPALGTFLIITIVFGLLIKRTNEVEKAVEERNRALGELRDAKSKLLEGDETGTSSANVKEALKQFGIALDKEESLRTIVPGVVRIVPASNGNQKEEEARLAAKQFLGKDTAIGAAPKIKEGDGRLPAAALVLLALVGLSMVGLLVLLSLDPMTTNAVLNTASGSPGNFL